MTDCSSPSNLGDVVERPLRKRREGVEAGLGKERQAEQDTVLAARIGRIEAIGAGIGTAGWKGRVGVQVVRRCEEFGGFDASAFWERRHPRLLSLVLQSTRYLLTSLQLCKRHNWTQLMYLEPQIVSYVHYYFYKEEAWPNGTLYLVISHMARIFGSFSRISLTI